MIDAFELTRQVHSPFVFYSSRDDRIHLVETGMGENAGRWSHVRLPSIGGTSPRCMVKCGDCRPWRRDSRHGL